MNRDKRNSIKKMVQTARALLLKEAREILEGVYGLHGDGNFEDAASLPELKEPQKGETRERLESFLREEAQAGLKGTEAIDKLVKEIAFTHLNRFVAFKMMETRKIIRQTVTRGPDSNAFKFYLVDHPEEEQIYNTGRSDEAYEHFLLWQSGELAKEIQVLFDPDNLPSRIFPRPRLLKELLALLNEEAVADIWREDETIGWVYQYFIEEDKDRVFNKIYTQKQKMDLRDIPSATQLLPPKWIVQYLVENILGRLWLRMHPDSTLMGKMKYYVPNENDRQPIPLKPVRKITLLDPACGTMHFGMVAFDLFYEMYMEELERAGQDGWPEKPSVGDKTEIPASIIENNLYGIDLDLRAIQLSALSLYIKAKTKNGAVTLKRLNLTYTDIPAFSEETINTFVDSLDATHAVTRKLLRLILPILNKAYYLGSLLKIETVVQEFIERERIALKDFGPKQLELF
ncbi:MAG: SAM-dependent methyltransferase, partial [Nitrospirota bacterium]|nr:SAM-dependent methyltransferase [Nitrospirota bacterium]